MKTLATILLFLIAPVILLAQIPEAFKKIDGSTGEFKEGAYYWVIINTDGDDNTIQSLNWNNKEQSIYTQDSVVAFRNLPQLLNWLDEKSIRYDTTAAGALPQGLREAAVAQIKNRLPKAKSKIN